MRHSAGDDHLAVLGRAPILDDDVIAYADLLVDRESFDAGTAVIRFPTKSSGRRSFRADDGWRISRRRHARAAVRRRAPGASAPSRQINQVSGPLDEALVLQISEYLRKWPAKAETAAVPRSSARSRALDESLGVIGSPRAWSMAAWRHRRKESESTRSFNLRSPRSNDVRHALHAHGHGPDSVGESAVGNSDRARRMPSWLVVPRRTPRSLRRHRRAAPAPCGCATASSGIMKTPAIWRRMCSSAPIAA